MQSSTLSKYSSSTIASGFARKDGKTAVEVIRFLLDLPLHYCDYKQSLQSQNVYPELLIER